MKIAPKYHLTKKNLDGVSSRYFFWLKESNNWSLVFGMIRQILLLKVIFLLKKGHWKIGSLSEMQEGVKSNFRFSSASSTLFAFQESLETFWSNLPSPAQLEKNFKASAWKKISLEESRFFKFSKNMNDQNYSLYRVSQHSTGTYRLMGHFLTLLVQNLFEDTVLFKIGPGQKSVQLFPIWTILP